MEGNRKMKPKKASRQTVYQEKHKALGLCRLCSEPIFRGGLCEKHYISKRKHANDKHRRIRND
jgi:hypothetical protein